MQNPFEIIIDRLNAIQDRVGRIDTAIQAASYTSQSLHFPLPEEDSDRAAQKPVKKPVRNSAKREVSY